MFLLKNNFFGVSILVLVMSFSLFSACTKKKIQEENNVPTQELLVGEMSPYLIEGDTVFVNNQYCASSRTLMAKENLGKWISTVEYTGENPKFKGKKLIFNQCCSGCMQAFPTQWQDNSKGILHFHGLE